jgi:hypothetical protein
MRIDKKTAEPMAGNAMGERRKRSISLRGGGAEIVGDGGS